MYDLRNHNISKLCRCSRCKRIQYCGTEHQKQHWKDHKPICKAIPDVLQTCSVEDVDATPEEYCEQKLKMIHMVTQKLGRPLYLYEAQMISFPVECAVCWKWHGDTLKTCQNCVASYCEIHIDSIEHSNICATLSLYYRIGLFSQSKYNCQDHYSQQVYNTKSFQDMKGFINAYGGIEADLLLEVSYDVLEARHSHHLTCPLTLFHAMRLLEYVPDRKDLHVIHVVSVCALQEVMLTIWDVLLHLTDISSLAIIIIGPNIENTSPLLRYCTSQQKKLSIEFYEDSYENYVRDPSSLRPDLVVAFQMVMHKKQPDSPKETWATTIRLLANQNCPFILTGFDRQNLEGNIVCINTILDKKIDSHYIGKNPFASLRPYRYFNPDKVFYDNQYVGIYRSLYPN
ncbi:PREDICTED: uncharacterized protein LOC105562330 isoform X2 [Vollenhovia emeryi]|uniref:uncharacterized protein LOC105562330 isoform X2 n=1 Tax=Vollenhovia emeryi TaxID=411798 RepID=UPI0005F559C5|nr:PREDICTED: uncharacterized protein LOC105562330 isoform X2 [Vollenhovia emeryi]